jgi:hypothetical protein
VVQLVAADPSQFNATPNAALANAAARRLGGDPGMASIIGAPSQPMSPNPGTYGPPTNVPVNQAPPAHQVPGGYAPNPGTIFGGAPNSTTPQQIQSPVGAVHPQNFANPDPLIGGTGDPNLDKYLGTDATYQSQLSDLIRNYDQYNSQKNLTSSQTQADYDAKQRSLDTQSTQDRLNMRNAAAARGILQSGIYANQLGQYNDANQQQLTNLLGGLQNSKDNANLAYNNFVANEMASKEQAIQQAAARRSAQLGLV